jgi:hypothetical protein
MRTKHILFAFAALALAQVACFAQNPPQSEDPALTAARAYVKSVNEYALKQGSPDLIIADVSDYNEDSKPVWKKYSSEEELENSREEEESYTIAYVWFQDRLPTAVNFTYSSPSGDWALYVEYVFRTDGSAAGIRRELRTFQGNIAVTNISFLDEKGKLLKETTEFADLETQKPVPPTKNYADIDVDIYKRVSDLPFAAMLKPVSGKQ